MAGKGHRQVTVTIKGVDVKCDPDPAQCYWITGPDNIRWVFPDPPPGVEQVVIEWQNPGPPFRAEPMFHGMGAQPSTVGSRLPDLVSFGNNQIQGRYKYAVICLDANGKVVAQVDPGGNNDPQPPN